MSLRRELELWMTELDLAPGVVASGVLLMPETLWVACNAETLADRLAEHLQRKKLDRGQVLDALRLAPTIGAVQTETLVISLPGRRGRAGMRELRYEVALAELGPELWLGVAPTLAATVTGDSLDSCRVALRERVRAGLIFDKTLEDAEALLVSQVGAGLRAHKATATLEARTRAELAALRSRKDPRLPRVAKQRQASRPTAFHLDKELAALGRAAAGRGGRGVLLVGPHGVGKSALLDEWLRRADGHIDGAPVWEVAPGQLLLDLMAEGDGWQQGLGEAVTELRAAGAWLRVTRLAELFEVGRYEGNSTSIGEALRTPLHRGELRLLTEATAEEIARIEARYPGWLDGLARVPVDEPGARLPQIAATWASSRGLNVGREALDELVRLQKRFTPHAGFPARTLRFLDSMGEAARATGAPLDRDAVLQRFCEESGLLRKLIDPRAPLPLDELRAFFEARIYGQPAAIAAVVEAIAAMKADVARHGKPLASFLLVGPTGVGKTETARALAELLFGSRERMIRFDMSEYGAPQAVTRLVGGADGGEGALTGAVRREPFAVLLFDEVEKAHPAFLDLLLQVLGEGRLTDDAGRVADFNAAVVLLTSNVGGAETQRAPSGFVAEATARRMEGQVQHAVTQWLRPELRNRLDRVLVYAPLGPDAVRRVLDRELVALRRRPGLAGLDLRLSEAAIGVLARAGYHEAWGGRQMIRAIEGRLVGPIAAELARHRRAEGLRLDIDAHGEALSVRASAAPTPAARDDQPLLDLFMLHRNITTLLASRAFATLDAHAQHALRRQREGTTSAEITLRESLRSLEPEALEALLDAGSQALADGPPVDSPRRHAALQQKLVAGLRALHHHNRPQDAACILGVYGRDATLLRQLHATLLALCARLGLRVADGALYPVKDQLVLVEPANARPPDGASEVVGYELFVEGEAAFVALEEETRLVEVVGRGARATRLRVMCVEAPPAEGPEANPTLQLDRARWAAKRPAGVQRQQFYEGRPTRILRDGGLTDLDARGKIERTLPAPWEPAMIAARVADLLPRLLARMD